MAGEATLTGIGTFGVSSANLKVAIDALNLGATTEGASTKTLYFVPSANGMVVTVYQVARTA